MSRPLNATERGMAAYALALAPLEKSPPCPECGADMEAAGDVGGRQQWECACGRAASAADGVYARTDEGAFSELAQVIAEDTGTIWVATMETQHFGFVAAGASEEEAFEALKRGWALHAARHPGAIVDPTEALEDYGANVIEMTLGQAYRDGRAIG